MAVNTVVVSAGTQAFTCDIEATLDADVTTGNIPHGLGLGPADNPLEVSITPLQALAYLSTWFVATLDSTNLVLTKANALNSGGAGAQIRVTVKRPHSITR